MAQGRGTDPQTSDSEHIVLRETLNELRHALMHGDSRNLARPLLRSFLAYTRGHIGRTDRTPHAPVDQERTQKIEALMDRFERGEVALDLQLLHVFDDWFAHPIQRADRSSRPWLMGH